MTTKYKIKTVIGTLGDFASEWMTPKDWKEWSKTVKELKESGEFGKEQEITISVANNPLFDDVGKSNILTSTDFFIIDFSK